MLAPSFQIPDSLQLHSLCGHQRESKKDVEIMEFYQSIVFLLVSFAASVVGAICGIGGGVIIKPTLDLFGWATVSAISFLSGCTVLSMSCYSVGKSILSGEKSVKTSTGTPLAIGAAGGGVIGKALFTFLRSQYENPNAVGAVQSACLMIITVGTLLYTVNKARIKPNVMNGILLCLAIGFVLGMMSSFLGIGGGPINIVVLYHFFAMDTKTAAANSLYIILFSQVTNLMCSVITATVPPIDFVTLILMISGGVFGGIVGRSINKRIDNTRAERMFVVLMVVVILISLYNTWKYAGA